MPDAHDSGSLAALQKGIGEFNEREFFQCHETLEDLWRHYDQPDRECIQGIIQIAVGYHHLLRRNREGALKLFKRGRQRIERFAPVHFGVDIERLCSEVQEDIDRLQGAADGDEPCLNIPVIHVRT